MANGTDTSHLPSPIRGRKEVRLEETADRPRTASEEKRFAWNGMVREDDEHSFIIFALFQL